MKHEIFINGYIGDLSEMMGQYDYFTLKDLEIAISAMPQNATELNVKINSGGGYVTEGFAIHDRLVAMDIPVSTEILGMCGSIATIISQAPKSQNKGGIRAMHPNSEFFVHNAAWSPQTPEPQNAADLKKIVEDLSRTDRLLSDFYANVSGANVLWIEDKMKLETTLTAKEAKDNGLIDEILGSQIIAYTKYRLVAVTKLETKQNSNTMSEIKNEIKAGFSKLESLFASMLKGKTVDVKVDLQDGGSVFADTDTVAVGTKLFTDEAMTTPVADGDITLADGTVVSVAAGAVVEVKAATVAKTELEIANEKIAELTATIAAKEAEITAAKDEVTQIKATATEIQNEFVNLKAQIETGTKETFKAEVTREVTGEPKKDWKTLAAERRAEKK